MTNYAKMLIGVICDFVISAGGVITGAMVQQGAVIMPNKAVLLLAAVGGLVTAAIHVQASYREPPTK